MVNHLSIMMIAVVIAMGMMLLASRASPALWKTPHGGDALLGLLLMIGLSLLVEGMGFPSPKVICIAPSAFRC